MVSLPHQPHQHTPVKAISVAKTNMHFDDLRNGKRIQMPGNHWAFKRENAWIMKKRNTFLFLNGTDLLVLECDLY